jgi:nicotinamide mononucleotide transporter
MTTLEIAANAITTLSIWLAARNHVHTWTTGIVGCALFGLQFFESRLYADATLQLFFIATSAIGWWQWRHGGTAGALAARPVTRTSLAALAWMLAAALAVTAGYGALLHRYTDAYQPFVDAAVLALSVVAQCLLMQRKLENWAFWIAVNTLSVPLFASRGLWLTAALYTAYWVNAWYGAWRWWREMRGQGGSSALAAGSAAS